MKAEHWREAFSRAARPVRGALHTVTSEAGFRAALERDAERWTLVGSDLGLPMHLVRKAEGGSRRVGPPAQRSWLRRILRFICSR